MERYNSQKFQEENLVDKSEESEKTESMNSVERILMHHFPVEKITEQEEDYWEDYTSYNVITPSEANSLMTPAKKSQTSIFNLSMGNRLLSNPASPSFQNESVVTLNLRIRKFESLLKFEKDKNKKFQQRLARIYSKFDAEK